MSYMTKIGYGCILAFFLSLSLVSACGGSASNTNAGPPVSTADAANVSANANAARSNVEELSLLINVPYEAEDIAWKQNAQRTSIIAVFRFSSDDADRAVTDAAKHGAGQYVSLPAEPWFPDELIAQAEVSGDNSLKGTAYPANEFFQPPYSKGRITRVEGVDYFILEVSAE